MHLAVIHSTSRHWKRCQTPQLRPLNCRFYQQVSYSTWTGIDVLEPNVGCEHHGIKRTWPARAMSDPVKGVFNENLNKTNALIQAYLQARPVQCRPCQGGEARQARQACRKSRTCVRKHAQTHARTNARTHARTSRNKLVHTYRHFKHLGMKWRPPVAA